MRTNIEPSKKTPRVLVIDDNKDISEMLKDYFEIENIECSIINDGKAGLEELRRDNGNYDFILLDLAMPQYSGFDVFNKLREENLLESKNIIIFTASAPKDNDPNRMIREGAKSILKKPFSLDDIRNLVERFTNY
jgi:DNA-binding response OmpR family regulator